MNDFHDDGRRILSAGLTIEIESHANRTHPELEFRSHREFVRGLELIHHAERKRYRNLVSSDVIVRKHDLYFQRKGEKCRNDFRTVIPHRKDTEAYGRLRRYEYRTNPIRMSGRLFNGGNRLRRRLHRLRESRSGAFLMRRRLNVLFRRPRLGYESLENGSHPHSVFRKSYERLYEHRTTDRNSVFADGASCGNILRRHDGIRL